MKTSIEYAIGVFFIFHLLLCVFFAECTFHEFLLLLYIM